MRFLTTAIMLTITSSLGGFALYKVNHLHSQIYKIQPRKSNSLPLKINSQVPENWGLEQIQNDKSLKINSNLKSIVVAVIDTGIDTKHPDLKNSLWQNMGETGLDKNGNLKSTNGVDDDKNGYIDDLHGWNFVSHNSDIMDLHGHGTHVAGIIGANTQQKFGFKGVAPQVKLMVLKFYDPMAIGKSNLNATVQAIRYAVDNGASIINYSGGGIEPSIEEFEAIQYAKNNKVLFVAAAGNEKSNSDQKMFYPAGYDLSNIISVAAIDQDGSLLETSNFGVNTVDIAAPGKYIFSTLPNNKYGAMSGTSQATAFVTGALALLLGQITADSDPAFFIHHLIMTGDTQMHLIGKTRAYTRLNTYRALAMKSQFQNIWGDNVEDNINNQIFDSENYINPVTESPLANQTTAFLESSD